MSTTATHEATADEIREQEREQVTREFNAERKELESRLKQMLRLEKEVAREDDKLSDAYWRIARKHLDSEPSEKELEAQRLADGAHKRLSGVSGTVVMLRRKLGQLDDAELERRLIKRANKKARTTNGPRAEKGATTMAGTTTRKKVDGKAEVPVELRKRIAKLVKGGMGVSAVAKLLNEDGTVRPASGKKNDWYARAVYNIATKELGVKDLKSTRKAKPVASRAVKDNPPRETQALPKKDNGNGAKPAATRKTSTSRKTTTSRKSATAGKGNGRKSAAARPVRGNKRTTTPDPKDAAGKGK